MVAVPDGNEGDEAELISPEIILEGETDLCLSFVYLMAGTGSGTLSVSLRHANGTTRALWLSFDEQSTEVCMMTSSNGNIFRVTDHLFGEFTPVICGCLWMFKFQTPFSYILNISNGIVLIWKQ